MILTPRNPEYEARTRGSFARQTFMARVGMTCDHVAPGEVDLSMPFDPELAQQHGFLHGGVVTSGMDSATGFAALSLMAADEGVLTVEFKTNFLSPARGERFLYTGRVLKPGSTLTVTEGRAWALTGADRKLIATMTATLMCVKGRDDVKG